MVLEEEARDDQLGAPDPSGQPLVEDAKGEDPPTIYGGVDLLTSNILEDDRATLIDASALDPAHCLNPLDVIDSAGPRRSDVGPAVATSPVATLDELAALCKSQFDALNQRQDTLLRICQRLLAERSERDAQDRLRDSLCDQLDAAKASYQANLVRPFVRRLLALDDLLNELDRPGASVTAAEILVQVRTHLQDTLVQQGIEQLWPKPGDRFDNQYHYAITTEPTSEASNHQRIARCAVSGYMQLAAHDRAGDVRAFVIRPARVVTWKYHEQAEAAGPRLDDQLGPAPVEAGLPEAGGE